MKTCFKCGEEKPLSAFYSHPQMKDGHLNKCIECTKADTAERVARLVSDPEWRIKELRRQRAKSALARANGTASPVKPETQQAWCERNPEKRRAHYAVSNAIRDGRLIRQPCFCGAKAEAHHADYSKPLEVTWLCRKHHMEEHVRQNEQKILTEG
jgi:hypothetical protein